MKAYPKYKDSGIEWIGEIPEHWQTLKLRRLSKVKRGASPRPIDDPKYFEENGQYSWVRIADVSASERYLNKTTQTLSELGSSLSVKREPGDFFLSIAGTVGKPIITKIKCCIHDGFVYFPELGINPEYLYYVFTSGLPYKGLGKWGTQLNLNTETVGDIYIPLLDNKDIEQIIAFLDHKTTQIDQSIEKQRTLIELLQEQRAAIINEAVTRGIDPEVSMKDSRVEWIGEIPAHWEILRMKNIGKVNQGLQIPIDKRYLSSEGDAKKYITIRTINSPDSTQYYIKDAPDSVICEKDDILIARTGATGQIVTGVTGVFHNNFFKFEYDRSLVQKNYLFQYLSTPRVVEYLLLVAGTTTIPDLNHGDFYNTNIPIPPLKEQQQIVQYIETETTRIDQEIAATQKEIELLGEYRQALIAEAVTGKIDVRDYALED